MKELKDWQQKAKEEQSDLATILDEAKWNLKEVKLYLGHQNTESATICLQLAQAGALIVIADRLSAIYEQMTKTHF